jgi:predicted nucleotidyltransferase component of viral defense system
MLTRHILTRRADDDGVDAAVVERDYVLAHVVAQLHVAKPADGGRLIFKGGTALRMVHVPDYRYSADLDFTLVGGGLEAAKAALRTAVAAAKEFSGIPQLRLSETADTLEYVGPLGSAKPRQVKVDIADTELVETIGTGTVLGDLWSDLPDPSPFDVYPLDEIGAEKLRCIIQRVQCRDLYDLYRLTDSLMVRLEEVVPLFERKCAAKGIVPDTFPERFDDRVGRYKKAWASEMSRHLTAMPRLDDVLRIVRRNLRQAGLTTDGP